MSQPIEVPVTLLPPIALPVSEMEPIQVPMVRTGERGPAGATGVVISPTAPAETDVLWLDTDEAEQTTTFYKAATVATNGAMLAACTLGQPVLFTVLADIDGSTNVNYTWNGTTLFFLGITEAEIQPTL